MSEYQMQEIIEELRGLHKDLKENLEYIALCMILNTMTNNGARKFNAKERRDLSKVMNGEEDMSLLLYDYLVNTVGSRACGGDKK